MKKQDIRKITERDESLDIVDQELDKLDAEVRDHLALVDDEMDGIE